MAARLAYFACNHDYEYCQLGNLIRATLMYCKYGMTENKGGLYLERLKVIIISLLNCKYEKATGAIGSRLWIQIEIKLYFHCLFGRHPTVMLISPVSLI